MRVNWPRLYLGQELGQGRTSNPLSPMCLAEPVGDVRLPRRFPIDDVASHGAGREAAGEGAHGDGRKGWSHGKLVRTPASGWLHRLVGLFVIHAFNRRDCRLDGDWIKRE